MLATKQVIAIDYKKNNMNTDRDTKQVANIKDNIVSLKHVVKGLRDTTAQSGLGT
jgi:hypothetical protein